VVVKQLLSSVGEAGTEEEKQRTLREFWNEAELMAYLGMLFCAPLNVFDLSTPTLSTCSNQQYVMLAH
jgi:hypothetical protein